MADIPIEELRKKAEGIYKLVIMAARRAQELSAGSGKLVEAGPSEKITTIALKEILEDRVTYKERKEPK